MGCHQGSMSDRSNTPLPEPDNGDSGFVEDHHTEGSESDSDRSEVSTSSPILPITSHRGHSRTMSGSRSYPSIIVTQTHKTEEENICTVEQSLAFLRTGLPKWIFHHPSFRKDEKNQMTWREVCRSSAAVLAINTVPEGFTTALPLSEELHWIKEDKIPLIIIDIPQSLQQYLDRCGTTGKDQEKILFGTETCTTTTLQNAPEVLRKLLDDTGEDDGYCSRLVSSGGSLEGEFLCDDETDVPGSPGTDTPPRWSAENVISLLHSLRPRDHSHIHQPDQSSQGITVPFIFEQLSKRVQALQGKRTSGTQPNIGNKTSQGYRDIGISDSESFHGKSTLDTTSFFSGRIIPGSSAATSSSASPIRIRPSILKNVYNSNGNNSYGTLSITLKREAMLFNRTTRTNYFPDPKLRSAQEFVLQDLQQHHQQLVQRLQEVIDDGDDKISRTRSTDVGTILSQTDMDLEDLPEEGIKWELASRYFQAALGVDEVIVAATLEFLGPEEAMQAFEAHPDSVDVQTQIVSNLRPHADAIELVCLAMLRFPLCTKIMVDGATLLCAFLQQSDEGYRLKDHKDSQLYQIGPPNAWRSRWVAKYGGTEALLKICTSSHQEYDNNILLVAIRALKILARYSKMSRYFIFQSTLVSEQPCWCACQVALTMEAAPEEIVAKAIDSLPESLGALEAISLRSDSSRQLIPYLPNLIDFGASTIPVLVHCAANAPPHLKERMELLVKENPGLASTQLNNVLKKSPQCQLFALRKKPTKPLSIREKKRSSRILETVDLDTQSDGSSPSTSSSRGSQNLEQDDEFGQWVPESYRVTARLDKEMWQEFRKTLSKDGIFHEEEGLYGTARLVRGDKLCDMTMEQVEKIFKFGNAHELRDISFIHAPSGRDTSYRGHFAEMLDIEVTMHDPNLIRDETGEDPIESLNDDLLTKVNSPKHRTGFEIERKKHKSSRRHRPSRSREERQSRTNGSRNKSPIQSRWFSFGRDSSDN